ncbi:MAG: cyclic nucleotide-binding domain-containing protein [Rhodospirillales bacterium]
MFVPDKKLKKELYQKGDVIFHEGEPGNAAYILESGSVEIVKTVEGSKVRLVTLRSGELFGEMAIIDGSPRMAAAEVIEDSVVVCIPRKMLERKLKKYDAFLQAMVKILINNLRNVHRVYMKRPRSVHDFINTIEYHAEGFRKYLESEKKPDPSGKAMKQLEIINPAIAELKAIFKDHSDRRRNIISDSDLAKRET